MQSNTRTNPIKDAITLLRIPFSIYLMPIYWFALSQSHSLDGLKAVWMGIILHLLVYPASNGYNSFMDRDEGSIGGLENPPPPNTFLFRITLALDLLALGLSALFVGIPFAMMVLGYILASRAYSYRGIRLKQYPIIGFLTVFIFQGGYTFAMVSWGCTSDFSFTAIDSWMGMLISSLLIGGGYPLTQIYQHESDREDGVTTLSMMLGYRGTFLFTVAGFGLLMPLMAYYFQERFQHFIVIQLFMLLVVIYFFWWMRQVWLDQKAASFKNMMRMNNISAFCLNTCFLFLLYA